MSPFNRPDIFLRLYRLLPLDNSILFLLDQALLYRTDHIQKTNRITRL